jgi:hypothetical protein
MRTALIVEASVIGWLRPRRAAAVRPSGGATFRFTLPVTIGDER